MAGMLVCSLLAVICSLLNQGLAIKCYTCSAIVDPKCKDNPPDSMLITCSSGIKGCLKLTMDSNSGKSVTRSCGTSTNVLKNECYTSKLESISTTTCYCETDGCNSSIPVAPSIPVGAIALMLLTFTLLWI